MTNDPNQTQQNAGGWQPVNQSQGYDQAQQYQASANQPYDQAQQYQASANQPNDQAQQYQASASRPYDQAQQYQASASQPYDQAQQYQGSYGQPSASAWENTGPVPQTGGSYVAQPAGQGDEFTGVVPGMSGLNRPVAPQQPKAPSPIIGALTDLGFTKFGTHQLASLAYLAVVASALIGWIGNVLSAFGVGNSFGGDTMRGLGVLLLGWIPVLATIVVARILLEVAVSIVDGHVEKKKDDNPGT